MRLTSTLFRPSTPRAYGDVPSGDLSPLKGEAGADGYELLADLVGGGPDVNPELTGQAKQAVYDEMRKTDPTVKSMLWFFDLPIRGAKWGLDPRTSEPEAKIIRDFVDWNLGVEDDHGVMDQSWSGLTGQGLEMKTWGSMFEELVWGDLTTWTDGGGDSHPVVPLARLAPRRPITISRVTRDPKGAFASVIQGLPGTKPIPASKLSYLVFEPEAGAWDGVSVLRPAWLAWRLKKALMISAGIGWDRFAMGLPVVWHPDNPDAEQTAKRIGREIRSHERAYVHFPVPDGETKDSASWAIEILNAASSLADPTPLINMCSTLEAEAGLQQFARQGLGETGARATAEAQADPFYMAVEAIADYLRRERQRQVIRRIVEVNFGKEAADRWTPVLTVGRIMPRNVVSISSALANLSTAGLTFTDRGAVDDIRDLLGFGQLAEGDLANAGIPRAQLLAILKSLGLDSETFAEIVNALPPEVGVAANRVEGGSPIA